ncbi:FG-GAP-like repeat-containing protein [Tunturiibacter gelidiferens]|uniref:FG-GAP-like repeat-containing protein n=1 Tax=Tunturiibacter gelidiferens TaxID=3069689 RepID=UPI003D9B0ED3
MVQNPSGARSLLAFLIAPFLTLPAVAQTQPPIYPLPIISPTTLVSAGVIGDFDGNGLPDQAYLSTAGAPYYQNNGVTVVLNEGPNNPTVSVVTNGLSCTPQYLVAADMNKDSKLDVVLTCQEGYVVVLFGNGDGTFQTPSYYAVANVFTIAPPVDLNGDGYPDIAVTVSTDPPNSGVLASVAVLLNKGSGAPGTLSPFTNYPQKQTESRFAINVGDFNGDGKQDIIAGNPAQVFYGNGDGTLQPPVLTTATSGYVTGDFNSDGKTDIAYINVVNDPVTGAATDSLQILLGTSNGQFTTAGTLPIPTSFGLPTIVPFQNTATSTEINLALVGSNSTIIDLNDGKGNFSAGPAYGVTGSTVTTQLGTGGNTNLLFTSIQPGTIIVPGNGDGTFQAPPATILNAAIGSCVFADLNSDGLTDTLCIDSASNLVAALGRGNGRFSTTSQNATTGQSIVTGDFNGDGKVDSITIYPGTYIHPHAGPNQPAPSNGQLFFYSGNSDGTFQPPATGIVLPVTAVDIPLVGDFNGDKILDLIIPFGCICVEPAPPSGVLFLAGKGDGTFAAPVSLSLPFSAVSFAADVNNDGKLDIVGTNTISLGNGDGTFQQLPLGITGTILAVADLNGDGKADLVINNYTATAIYAGNGDGTFQATPYFTTSLTGSAYIGDVNGDGHVDLLLASIQLSIFFGDGTGNFTPDPNTYPNAGAVGAFARVNNQAPSLPNDHTLDFVFNSGGGVTSFINQLNPAPTTPAPLPSKTTLTTSASSAAPGQQLTLTATITGATPTGKVTFASPTATLGTESLVDGVATLSFAFTTIGSYTVTATYAGDVANLSSTSAPVTVTVAAPDYTITASPSSAIIKAGQSATTTLTVTPVGGYTGTVKFSCGTLPIGVACNFSPSSVTPSSGAATSTLTITTTAPTTALLRGLSVPLQGIAWASLLLLTLSPRRIFRLNRHLARAGLLTLLLAAGLLSFSGCSSSSPSNPVTNPGTPAGVQTITLTTADSSGNLAHAINFQVTVQ